jgi:hypothetical protein
MARYRLDALAAAQEIAAVLERMSDQNTGSPVGARLPVSGVKPRLPSLN